MPQVPTVDHFGASPSPLPGVRQSTVATPELFGAAADQQIAMGKAALGAGDAATKLALQMREQADQVREDDALNQLRQKVLDLTYDNDTGFKTKKGNTALQPDDAGLSLSESYTGKLQRASDEIVSGLANENQRRNFLMKANDIVTNFRSDTLAHMRREGDHYALTTQEGTVKIGRETAIANWSDTSDTGPRQEAIDSVKGAVAKAGQLTGEGASETVAKMLAAESAIHLGIIDTALEEGEPAYAIDYFRKHGKEGTMTAADILKAQGALRKSSDARIVTGITGEVMKAHASAFMPSEFDRMVGIVRGLESGGRDTNPDGTPLTSTKGARYAMQVMPTTAQNPGFGILPAKNDSADEYNRVGRQYLAAMIQKYGDEAKALAAYNAGPDALDAAVAKAKGDGKPGGWLAYLPKETQGYVQSGLAKFNAGGGSGPMPTELEFVQSAIDRLPATRTPELVKLMRDAAEHQYKLIVGARKQYADQAESDVQQALIANGGDFAGLSLGLKTNLARLDPQAYSRVQDFAKKVGGVAETNLAAYSAAVAHPEELAKMPEAVFLDFAKRNFTETDGKQVADLRASVINGKVADTVDSINSPVINALLEERLPSLGIDAKPKRDDTKANARVGAIQKYIRDDILAQQQHLGRKMTPKEIGDRVDALFLKNVEFRNTLFGIEYGKSQERMLSLTPADLPSETRKGIEAAFAARGVTNPTDSDIMQAYWRWKNGR